MRLCLIYIQNLPFQMDGAFRMLLVDAALWLCQPLLCMQLCMELLPGRVVYCGGVSRRAIYSARRRAVELLG